MANPVPKQLTPFGPNNPPPKSPGRPKKRPVSEAYDEALRMDLPEPVRKAMNLPKGATWADAVAASMLKAAVLKGDVAAAKELREGTEGKAPMRISATVETSRRTEIIVTYEDAPQVVVDQNDDAIEVKALPAPAEESSNNDAK